MSYHASNPTTRHLLLSVGPLDPWRLAILSNTLTGDSNHEVFSYTANAWILCTTRSTRHYDKIVRSLTTDAFGVTVPAPWFLILDISGATAEGGSLPEPAWRWLQRHHMPKPS